VIKFRQILEKKSCLKHKKTNFIFQTSILAQFPAQNITAHILDYLSKLHPREKDLADLTLVPILDLCSRYKRQVLFFEDTRWLPASRAFNLSFSGIRGHIKKAICELVDQYLKVETLFQVNLKFFYLEEAFRALLNGTFFSYRWDIMTKLSQRFNLSTRIILLTLWA